MRPNVAMLRDTPPAVSLILLVIVTLSYTGCSAHARPSTTQEALAEASRSGNSLGDQVIVHDVPLPVCDVYLSWRESSDGLTEWYWEGVFYGTGEEGASVLALMLRRLPDESKVCWYIQDSRVATLPLPYWINEQLIKVCDEKRFRVFQADDEESRELSRRFVTRKRSGGKRESDRAKQTWEGW